MTLHYPRFGLKLGTKVQKMKQIFKQKMCACAQIRNKNSKKKEEFNLPNQIKKAREILK